MSGALFVILSGPVGALQDLILRLVGAQSE
jgi:hypothetical protein